MALLDVFTPHTLSFLTWREIGRLMARVACAWHDALPLDRRLNSIAWYALCQLLQTNKQQCALLHGRTADCR